MAHLQDSRDPGRRPHRRPESFSTSSAERPATRGLDSGLTASADVTRTGGQLRPKQPDRHISPSPRRHRWPPSPTCEDERTSLLREADGRRRWLDVARFAVPSRGMLDQDPLIDEVTGFANRNGHRSVPPAGEHDPLRNDVVRPSSAEDDTPCLARRRPSRLSIDIDKPLAPEFGARTASPYSFTPDQTFRDLSATARSLLSPPVASTSLGVPHAVPSGSRSMPSSPKRDSGYGPPPKGGVDYFAADIAVDDRPGTRPHTAAVDFATHGPRAKASHRNSFAETRRQTIEALPSVSNIRMESIRRTSSGILPIGLGLVAGPANLSPSSTPNSAADNASPRSRQASRNPSPNSSTQHVLPSPPHSPRVSLDSRDGTRSSYAASRTGSASGSRPSSPSPRAPLDSPRLPQTDVDWKPVMAANASRRSKPPSRLTSSMTQGSSPPLPMPPMPSLQHSATMPLPKTGYSNVLPYPLDDGPPSLFPAFPQTERESRYVEEPTSSLRPPGSAETKTKARSVSPARRSTLNAPPTAPQPATRPAMAVRHSSIEVPRAQVQGQSPTSSSRPTANESRRVSNPPSSQARQEIQALAKRHLPECDRPVPVTEKDDWYTLIGCPSLQFCPKCIDGAFERTLYRPLFRRSPPHPLSTEVQCALGGKPWIRLAWKATLVQQRPDLELVKEVSQLDQTTDPCPGHHQSFRNWYGICDPSGRFARDFFVCPTDVRKIEAMMPSLAGLFEPLPRRASLERRICALRAGGNRFGPYTDALSSGHEKAVTMRKAFDPAPLLALIDERTRVPECPGDTAQDPSRRWHYLPSAPLFTVCEDCYAAYIAPRLKHHNHHADSHSTSSPPLLTRFLRTPQPAPTLSTSTLATIASATTASDSSDPEAEAATAAGSSPIDEPDTGSRSCQLFHPRMRRLLFRAVRDNDPQRLGQRALERFADERRLRRRVAVLERKIRHHHPPHHGSSNGGGGGDADLRRWQRELARVQDDFRRRWKD